MTVRNAIAAAMLAALNAGTPPVVTEKSRGLEVPPGDTFNMTLKFSHENVEPPAGSDGKPHHRSPIRIRTMVFVLEGRARATGGATQEENCEVLTEWTTSKLGGSRLGGLVHHLEEAQIRYESIQGDVKYGKATMLLAATYQTLVNDATRQT